MHFVSVFWVCKELQRFSVKENIYLNESLIPFAHHQMNSNQITFIVEHIQNTGTIIANVHTVFQEYLVIIVVYKYLVQNFTRYKVK